MDMRYLVQGFLSFGLGWELSAGGIDRDPVGMTVNPIHPIVLLLLSRE